MTRSVWLKADDEVGGWEDRKRRITAGLEAGVDWVLVDEEDVERVRELGAVNIAAFGGDDVHVMEAEEDRTTADATIIGKDGEGDGTVDLPPDFSGSADLSAIRQDGDQPMGGYVRILDTEYETFAEEVARDAEYTIIIGSDWQIIPLENLIARIGEETELIAGVGMPISTALAITRRHAACASSITSLKNGSSNKFSKSGSLSNASLILPRKADRMMQPPRHISAIPP